MLPLKTPYYDLTLREGSDKLLIVFPGLAHNEGHYGFGGQSAHVEASRLIYANTRPEWTSGGIPALVDAVPAMLDELRALVAQSGARRVYVFGASMGGFGACLFSTLLNAEGAVVVAGQTVLDLPGTRAQRLLRGAVLRSPHADIRPVMERTPPRNLHMICGDRDDFDLMCLLHFAGIPGVHFHVFHKMDHHITSRMIASRQIGGLMTALVNGTLDVASLPGRLPMELDADVARAMRTLLSARAANDHPVVEAQARILIDALPDSAIGWRNLANSLRLRNQAGEAWDAYERALALDGDNPQVIAPAVLALMSLRRWQEAMALCQLGGDVAPKAVEFPRMRERIAAKLKAASPAE